VAKTLADARANAVRAYITGLRLDTGCHDEWHQWLALIESKGHLQRRPFFRYVIYVCALEHLESERRMRADRGYRDSRIGLHWFLRESGFLSEFGRARRSWFHVDKMTRKIQSREIRKRLIHQGRTVWEDYRIGLRFGVEAMSRSTNGRRPECSTHNLRDYVRQLISDWRDGLCGGPPKRKLPDRREPGVRWNNERRGDCREDARDDRRERREKHGY
jgi:hypothetical protein